MDWLDAAGAGVKAMHGHCLSLQRLFLERLTTAKTKLSSGQLAVADDANRGRFLSFRTEDAGTIDRELAKRNVVVDHRHDRLRIGFGVYHDENDVDRLVAALKEIG
jgi:selenocysteine lyase/cysteine desulfurase